MTDRPRKSTLPKALIIGARGEYWKERYSTSSFRVLISSECSLEVDVDRFHPEILLIHEEPSLCPDVVSKLKCLTVTEKLPVLVVTSEEQNGLSVKYEILEAGADQVVFETEGIEAVIEAAKALLESNFPVLGEQKVMDTVARALDAATTVGKNDNEDDEEKQPRLALSSSIAYAIDVAQKKYIYEIQGGVRERAELRRGRANSAVMLFCQMMGIEQGASLGEIKSAASRLVGDMEYLDKVTEEVLALRVAGQAILRLEE